MWIALTFFIFTIVGLCWQGLELLLYGEIQHRTVDNIIGIALTASIIINIYQNHKAQKVYEDQLKWNNHKYSEYKKHLAAVIKMCNCRKDEKSYLRKNN